MFKKNSRKIFAFFQNFGNYSSYFDETLCVFQKHQNGTNGFRNFGRNEIFFFMWLYEVFILNYYMKNLPSFRNLLRILKNHPVYFLHKIAEYSKFLCKMVKL